MNTKATNFAKLYGFIPFGAQMRTFWTGRYSTSAQYWYTNNIEWTKGLWQTDRRTDKYHKKEHFHWWHVLDDIFRIGSRSFCSWLDV